MKYKKINIAIFLIVICSILFIIWSCIFSGENNLIIEEIDIPNRYTFLLFPSKKTVIYQSELFRIEISKKMVERAVTASFAEIKRGTIKIIIDTNVGNYGYIKMSSLRFLPSDNAEEYIEGWRKYLKLQGYTDGRWNVHQLTNGNKLVELELIDSKHARSDTYRYETDGEKIIKVYQINNKSGIEMLIYGILFIFASAFIFFLLFLRRHGVKS